MHNITKSDKISHVLRQLPSLGDRIPKTLESIAFYARQLTRAEEAILQGCFRLRHAYFVEQRGWVAPNIEEPSLERDNYDLDALHMAALGEGKVAAYMRLLPCTSCTGFMLDHELRCVLDENARQVLPRENAVELSRFAMRYDVRSTSNDHAHVVEILFKRFYQESKMRGFMRFYIVVEPAWLRLFARRFGLTFQTIGTPYVFPDGTRTVVATATLEELEDGIRHFSPAKFAWYQQED